MRGILIAIALAVCPTAAAAQLVNPPLPVDTSGLQAQITAAATAANIARTAALSACQPSASVPPMEMVGGAAGSGDTCRLANAIQPRISRMVSGVTTSAGSGVITWPAMPTMPKLTVTPYVAANATQVPACYPVTGTVTVTGATIACYMTQTILGLGLVPFAKATAGVTFDVLALPGS